MGWMTGLLTALAAPVELTDAQTPWRVWLVQGGRLARHEHQGVLTIMAGHTQAKFNPASTHPHVVEWHRLSPQPPEDWMSSTYNDERWARYTPGELADWVGSYGAPKGRWIGGYYIWALHARSLFQVDDPARSRDVQLEIEFLGGVVVYLNGREVGRSHMPAASVQQRTWEKDVIRGPAADNPQLAFPSAQSGIMAIADDYPETAYKMPDGEWLTMYRKTDARLQSPQVLERYAQRVRRATIVLPASAMVKGANVIAVEIRHAPFAQPTPVDWSHAGLRALRITSASGAGVTAYAQLTRGTRVWSAHPEEQVVHEIAAKPFIEDAYLPWVGPTRGTSLKGIQLGHPLESLRPMRFIAPRNGVGIGQVAVTDLDGLRDVSASARALTGPGGAQLPAAAIEVVFAGIHANVHYPDALMPTAPADQKTIPVWLRVRTPKDQPPGWYTVGLDIGANGKRFTVPAQVFVTGFVLPSPSSFGGATSFVQSPESVATQYGVEMWSDAHWKLMEKSFALMGALGNDVVYVPVLEGKRRSPNPMIRFVKTGDTWKPDFAVLNRYLDAYAKYNTPPKAISLWVWDAVSARRIADVYEGRQVPSREVAMRRPPTVQTVDPATGALGTAEIPQFTDPGAEKFYVPLIEGMHELVERRNWSRRCVVLGIGGDIRPAKEDADVVRLWAPWVRWHGISHWSGDPGWGAYRATGADDPKQIALREGRFISMNDQEVGLREDPFIYRGWSAYQAHGRREPLEHWLSIPWDYVRIGGMRGQCGEAPPPFFCQTLGVMSMEWGRIGLDYWDQSGTARFRKDSWDILNAVSWPGPAGAEPTLRYEMIRQGFQLTQARLAIGRGAMNLPPDQKKAYWDTVDDFLKWITLIFLGQVELGYDWGAFAASQYASAGTLTGNPDTAPWDQPPR